MKILLAADQYPEYINGAATFTSRLAAGLASSGHTVDLLWPSADGDHQTYLDQGVRVHRLSSVALPGRPRMQVCTPRVVARQVEQILQITRPDVVHVQSHLALGRSLLRAAQAAGIPVLATNHFMPENIVPHVPVARRFPALAARLAWRDLEHVFAGADLLTAPTQRAVDLMARSTRLPPAEVISCGVDLDRYRAGTAAGAPSISRGAGPTVLFVGRLEPEKHVDELLAAFARVPAALGARLEIVGMGSLRSPLEGQARALGLDGAVTFTGAIGDDALLDAYRRADLFVMPGTAELQSLATLEAMAAGLPVVAADAMALPHLVQDGRNGYLYRPQDVDALATRVIRVLADPGLRLRLGHGSEVIAEDHALSATLAAFEGHYARLVAARSRQVSTRDDALLLTS
jgi:phosphatidylinositol alpha 1,6-mannosyltransferase